MSTAARVIRAIPGLVVSEAPVDRMAYGRDLWPRHHLLVRHRKVVETTRPAVIVWPTSTEQVAAVVRACAEQGVPLVPFGAGSGVCGGILPDESTVVLDLKRLASVRRLDPSQPSLDVEAGALGITLEEWLQREGWTIGHFPSSILCSTVGGWLAARGAGQCSGRYGKIEDMVASLELVDGRGEIHQLHRRPHGLDLTPLLIGSEGTLGVLTACTLRLHRVPTSRAFRAFTFPTTEAGWEALRAMFQQGLRPAVSRLYDPFDSLLARQGSVRTRERNVTSGGYGVLGQMLRFPRVLNAMIDTMVDRAVGAMLILIFEGNDQEPHEDADAAAALVRGCGGISLGEGPARRWLEHRYSVSYRQAPVFRSGAFSDTFEVAAPWSRFKALYEGVRRALAEKVFVMAHLSHAYPDGCCVYFSFAGSAATEEEALRLYDATWAAAMQAALEAGGTISHHHGIGRSKAPRLGEELGRGVDVVRGLMRAFDPAGVMNRGNLLPREPSIPLRLPVLPRGFVLDEVSMLATIPAAMTLREVQARLEPRGWRLPLTTQVDGSLPVGAWIEAGAPGAFDPWSDPCDHLLAGLRAVLPSGDDLLIRPCPRRAAGPDLIALFAGAAGRFGRVEQIDLRIRRMNEPPARPLPFAGPRDLPLSPGESVLIERIRAEL
ncbi:MAG: FAD-binding protein [Myxococcales bacterium]|nr:FAD-binding protein [Polyangiaceae bacterium]MDW8251209.1 FAD-binding protein [Myxococcales bacterium]